MAVHLVLAQFWGWLTLIMILVYFVRGDVLKEVKLLMVGNRGFAIGYGIASLMVGLGSVILFSRITPDWRLLVTAFGWAALAKGILVLAWPEIAHSTRFETRLRSSRISLVIAGIAAIVLLYKGYGF